jgi:putative transposase
MAQGGRVYHVLNRANARMRIFRKDADYAAFEATMAEVRERIPMRLLAWCLMPNHWHLVLWPREDGHLSHYLRLLTLTHTQRWHAAHRTVGTGHLYQGRFKSFLVETDDHLLTVCRYVERNALRANLVRKAENWRWGSLWRYRYGDQAEQTLLSEWPVNRPRNWVGYVNRPHTAAELDALRRCVNRGAPYGSDTWVQRTAKQLGLDSTLRARGRPRREVSP